MLGAIDANSTVTALNQINLEFERDKLMPIKSYSLLAILFNKPITVFDVDASVVVPTVELRAEVAVAVFDEEVLMAEVFIAVSVEVSTILITSF